MYFVIRKVGRIQKLFPLCQPSKRVVYTKNVPISYDLRIIRSQRQQKMLTMPYKLIH